LHRGDDDLLALGDELPEVARALGVADCRAHLCELLDGVADLLVEDLPIGDDDDRIECRRIPLWVPRPMQPDELVGEPGDGIGLAAPAECWIR
jgi:hypothetical protein